MSEQIIKQPNGKYCVFSSVIDNIVLENASKDDIVKEWSDYLVKDMKRQIDDIINQLENGEKPYYQFTHTYESMLERIKTIHGEQELKRVKNVTSKV